MQNKLLKMVPLESEQKDDKIDLDEEEETRRKLLKIYITIARSELTLTNRLQMEPDGFPIQDISNCFVCGILINSTSGCYSKYGVTCLFCLKAFKEDILPVFISKNHESFFNLQQLKEYYNFQNPS